MNLLKPFDGGLKTSMRKAAQPFGGMGSSTPRRQRGWRLHHHGGDVCCVFVLCVVMLSGRRHSPYVEKIILRWGYRCYIVRHPSLHHA